MSQTLVLETTEQSFQKAIDTKLKEGYKVMAGSTFIKSLLWDISVPEGEMLNDTEHVLSLAITGKYDFLIYSKNISTFKVEVNSKLERGEYFAVVGSLSADLIKKDGFNANTSRAYITYYSCTLYKG